MNKGTFSGARRNTKSAVDQGRMGDAVAFTPSEDDPEELRLFLAGTKPQVSKYKNYTARTVSTGVTGIRNYHRVQTRTSTVVTLYDYGTTIINSHTWYIQ